MNRYGWLRVRVNASAPYMRGDEPACYDFGRGIHQCALHAWG